MKKTDFLGLVAAGITWGCASGPIEPITELPRQLTQAERQLVEADNDFALRLLEGVHAEIARDSNLFVSPLSISMALGMTLNGAMAETFDAMSATLGYPDMQIRDINQGYRDLIDLLVNLDERVTMNIANSVWHRPEFSVRAPFVQSLQDFFRATVRGLDFSLPNAPDIIDQWANDNTNGLIKQIAPRPIPSEIVMFLLNAVYFKGDWTHQFDKGLTRDAPFRLANGTELSVPTMSHKEPVPVRLGGDDLVDLVELAYGGDAFAMLVAVPRGDATLDDVIAVLDGARWSQWTSGLQDVEKTVLMPKLDIQFGVKLNAVLAALGMDIAFDPQRADFRGINEAGQLYIDRVDHKTYLRVDEEGTEAAAVTSVGVGVTSAPVPFLVDRPFLMFIRERFSGAILFMGRVVNPLEGQ